jgi:probable F420-dependent oxidoreductase
MAMNLERLGLWQSVDQMPSPAAATFARTVEAWGYGALWQPEAVGRNALVASSWLLANTTTLTIATGIANIYARDAQAAFAAQQGLAEQSGDRFLLGLGVSHVPLVEGMRGHHYGKPLSTMRAYLEAMGRASFMAAKPDAKPKTVIAALGPRMLELAAELADGAHPYNVTPDHTADARKRLGPGKLLCVEQKVLLQTDPAKARAAARAVLSIYLGLPNYQNGWVHQGFNEDDWSNGGSDRLMDAMVAWGDEAAIRSRIQAHWDAGADHVCIQALTNDGHGVAHETLALLAPAGAK